MHRVTLVLLLPAAAALAPWIDTIPEHRIACVSGNAASDTELVKAFPALINAFTEGEVWEAGAPFLFSAKETATGAVDWEVCAAVSPAEVFPDGGKLKARKLPRTEALLAYCPGVPVEGSASGCSDVVRSFLKGRKVGFVPVRPQRIVPVAPGEDASKPLLLGSLLRLRPLPSFPGPAPAEEARFKDKDSSPRVLFSEAASTPTPVPAAGQAGTLVALPLTAEEHALLIAPPPTPTPLATTAPTETPAATTNPTPAPPPAAPAQAPIPVSSRGRR